MAQKQYKPHYEHLKNKWTEQQRSLQKNLWERHKEAFAWLERSSKNFAIGSMSGLLLLTNPATSALLIHPPPPKEQPVESAEDKKKHLIKDLSYLLPSQMRALHEDEEKVIAQTLSRHFNMIVASSLQGKRLNRSYGLIGAEQHLTRYPGDTMETHFPTQEEANAHWSSGMAPGRGAWGYFAPSQAEMTDKDIQREKYYIAVQTFLAPDYNDHVREYSEFFKYRKMLVVNPENGKALIADIADAGPAEWTGKHLGGAPEVMRYLERKDGAQKGPVLYFFIDDQDDKIPLGPVL